jgi:hypothetical protein
MKQVRFSGHASEMAIRTRQERESRNAARVSAYNARIAQRENRLEEMSKRRVRTWNQGRYLSWLAQGLHFLWAASGGHPDQPQLEGATREEAAWNAGSDGEELVAGFLAARLNDDWTLIGGYKNGAGEIDYVLVGPAGLFTIEVKFRNAAVTIQGDKWTADKYDRYGNLVERDVPIVDRGGRSPARQLNEPTDRLVSFLRKQLPEIDAMRVVVLSHERSRLVAVSQPAAIPVVLGEWPLLDMFKLNPYRLSSADQQRVIALIRRDHEFNSKRRESGGKSSTGSTMQSRAG